MKKTTFAVTDPNGKTHLRTTTAHYVGAILTERPDGSFYDATWSASITRLENVVKKSPTAILAFASVSPVSAFKFSVTAHGKTTNHTSNTNNIKAAVVCDCKHVETGETHRRIDTFTDPVQAGRYAVGTVKNNDEYLENYYKWSAPNPTSPETRPRSYSASRHEMDVAVVSIEWRA